MELSISLQYPALRDDSLLSATDDPLDLQGLWPITADLTDAARRVSVSLAVISRSLLQDSDSTASSLRQMLLEIRARLVYVFCDIGAFVVAETSQLIRITSKVVAAHLQNEPNPSAALEYMVATILDSCSSSNRLLLETITAYEEFIASFRQYQSRTRSIHPTSVASILHSLGSLVSPTIPPNTFSSSTQDPQQHIDAVIHDLTLMNTSMDRIEVFWRKRQSLYSDSGYTFGHEQMERFHRSCNQLVNTYMDFVDPLRFGQDILSQAQPSIDVPPETLDEETSSKLSWRSLLR